MRPRYCIMALALCLTLSAAYASAETIAEIKEVDQYGIPVGIGQVVTVSGIATVANGTYSARDLDIHIQDANAGIYLYLRNGSFLDVALGDSIVVTGLIDQEGRTPRRNHTKLSLLSADGLEVVGKTAPPEPLLVTAADLAVEAEPPVETYEGVLVRVEGLTIDPEDWPIAGSEKFITATDGTYELLIRLDRDTDIPGSEPPESPFIAVGVIIQDSSNPFAGYHIWPRSRFEDLLAMGNG